MGNTDKNNTKKCRRKIKIRLADPNIPDSYVCEVFDSSLENEEENSKNEEVSEEKPKNYFEILMQKKCSKNGVIDSVNERKSIKHGSHALFNKKNQKNLNLSTNLENVRTKESKCESDSSEDESLFQIQEKYSLKSIDVKEENNCVIEVEEEISNKTVFSKIKPPKVDLSQKKTLGILSYFSKTETSSKNKENCDIEEITVLSHSINSSKTVKPLKKHGTNKGNVKLAPLFCKKENKVIDSATQKARLEFLYKSSPPTIKKSDTKVSEYVSTFPVVSHVQQRNDSVCWSCREIHIPIPELSNSEEWVLNSDKKFSLQVKHLNSVSSTVANHIVKIDKEFFSKAKCKYSDCNLNSVIDGLKEKNDKFSARVEEIEKLKSSQDSNENYEELNVLWTEKYKPKSNEILGNENVMRRLKKWLESWKSFDEELKALVRNRSLKNVKEEDDDSDDDFLESDSENYGLKAPGNVCFVSGPNGCGKTAMVYALANELEFGVLELNAGSKRTGKKVLSDLQEATQSHKVHRVNLLPTDKPQTGVKKKRGRKKKIKKLDVKKPPDQSNDSKISLILIEDADIVFEDHDEGFFSSIATLVQTSKRPLIFLTNEPNCHYLYNIKPEQCLILEMELPSFYISCAILDIVSSLEGVSFNKEVLESVVRQNNFDLRKSLLELQFWMHSCKNPIDFNKKFDLGQLWWGLCKFLYKQDIRHFVRPKTRKRKRMNDLFDSSDEEVEVTAKKFKPETESPNMSSLPSPNLIQNKSSNVPIESYFKVLDLASCLDCFALPGSQEPIPGIEYKARDSLCLDENMEGTTWERNSFGEMISNEIVLLTASCFGRESEDGNRKLDFVSPCWEEIRWRNSQEKATHELSALVTLQRGRDNRSLHLDYLPILRNICRIERNRSEMNPKRKNRFYHYLNNLGFELTDENLDINCDVFNR